jgi:hypothetical protein
VLSVSGMIVKGIGVILAIVGLALLLAAVGLQFMGVHVEPVLLELILGLCFLGLGVWLIGGGKITP